MTKRDASGSPHPPAHDVAELYNQKDRQIKKGGRAAHYHIGAAYATEVLADKLDDLHVDSTWNVLDICCGWGGPAQYVAERFGCRIVAIDIAQRSIESARELLLGTKVEKLIEFRHGDALDLPLESGETGLVWSQDGFCHIADRRSLLTECYRVLRPGGYLVFTDWLRSDLISSAELESFCTAWSIPSLATFDSYPSLATEIGFQMVSREQVGREYVVVQEALRIEQGGSTIQRMAKSSENADESINEQGLESYLNKLERHKMSLYFAQGKLDIGRFVCAKPATPR